MRDEWLHGVVLPDQTFLVFGQVPLAEGHSRTWNFLKQEIVATRLEAIVIRFLLLLGALADTGMIRGSEVVRTK